MRKFIAVVTLIVFTGLYNYSIVKTQKHIDEGRVVNLSLAPVDPRSLMQGDFMRLNFDVATQIREAMSTNASTTDFQYLTPDTRYVVVRLSADNVAEFVRLDDESPLQAGEVKLEFRIRNNRIKFATNAYFFEEGKGEAYEEAVFGQFAVNEKGQVLLTHLLDENLKVLSAN